MVESARDKEIKQESGAKLKLPYDSAFCNHTAVLAVFTGTRQDASTSW